MPSIELHQLEELWNFTASSAFRIKFESLNLEYKQIDSVERDGAILKVLNALDSDLVRGGAHRANDWEKGWGENLDNFKRTGDLNDVVPKYFNKIPLIRWKQDWIQPVSPTMEFDMLGLIINYMSEEFLSGSRDVYEFGCGTGHNLLKVREYLPDANLMGLDWATSSQQLINEIAISTSDKRLLGENFDYFNPNYEVTLAEKSSVFTVASLEQTGTDFTKFIDFLLVNKPQIIVNIEPMWEPLNSDHLLDYLSIRYFKKRNYLDGLQKYLEALAEQGKVEILKTQRTYVGSFFVDGYSMIIWKPI